MEGASPLHQPPQAFRTPPPHPRTPPPSSPTPPPSPIHHPSGQTAQAHTPLLYLPGLKALSARPACRWEVLVNPPEGDYLFSYST